MPILLYCLRNCPFKCVYSAHCPRICNPIMLLIASPCHLFPLIRDSSICDVELDYPQCPQCFVAVVFPFSIGQTVRRRVFCPMVILVCPSKERDSLTCLGRQNSRNVSNCANHPTMHQDAIRMRSKKRLHSLGPPFQIHAYCI